MDLTEQFDHLLTTDSVAALTAHQLLEPVEGPDGVVFPPTFAPVSKGEKGDYNIDSVEEAMGGGNVCIIDTVGAEANRIEPLFKPDKCEGKYAGLVPQVWIKVRCTAPGKEREWKVNLLDAGHRAGDAVIRFTKLGERIFEAFKDYGEFGNAEKLAQIAPTSFVFGVWDSRGTQEKIARIFRSVVRATNVARLNRSAQYFRTVKYVENGLVPEDLDRGGGDKDPLSQEGFNDNPAGGAPGGVVVRGEIRRDMTINLSALRRLRVPSVEDPTKNDAERTLQLRRYILGLSLVAATAPTEDRYNLREGCQLRLKSGTKTVWQEVRYEEEGKPLPELATSAFEYAKLAADKFGVTNPPETEFEPAIAERWLRLSEDQQKKLRLVAPMTKQHFEAPGVQTVKGTIVSLLPDGAGLKLMTGGKNKQEVEVQFTEETKFVAKDGSTISVTALAAKNKVEVEHASYVARSVTLK